MSAYGQLPTLNLLNRIFPSKSPHFTPVGYGLEKSGPKIQLGGDTRRLADAILVNLNGVTGTRIVTSVTRSASARPAPEARTDTGSTSRTIWRSSRRSA